MKKKIKTNKIRSFEQLGKLVTAENYADIVTCLCGSIALHLECKQRGIKQKFIGMDWRDDGKNEITGIALEVKNVKIMKRN